MRWKSGLNINLLRTLMIISKLFAEKRLRKVKIGELKKSEQSKT